MLAYRTLAAAFDDHKERGAKSVRVEALFVTQSVTHTHSAQQLLVPAGNGQEAIPPQLLLRMSEMCQGGDGPDKTLPLVSRALGVLLASRDHLLVVDQLQDGFIKGYWNAACPAPLDASVQPKHSTVVVTELVLRACRAVALPLNERITNSHGFLEVTRKARWHEQSPVDKKTS